MSSQRKVYSIDGNIGSGKSTFLEYLKTTLIRSVFGQKVIYLAEPVEEWNKLKDDNGDTILKKFYNDQKRYSFSFQMMAYISRLASLQKAMKEYPNAIIITERCVHTDRHVFAKMLRDSGMIEDIEYKIYLQWFDHFIQDIPLTGLIYINTPPTLCYTRIQQRGRDGETIPIEYLKKCDKYHKDWIAMYPSEKVLYLNGNIDKNEVNYYEHFKQVTNFITW